MHYTNDVGLDFGNISKSILNVPCTSGQGLVYVKYVISFKKSYRCPKFDGDAKQTLEIREERKRNLKLGELGKVNFRIF